MKMDRDTLLDIWETLLDYDQDMPDGEYSDGIRSAASLVLGLADGIEE